MPIQYQIIPDANLVVKVYHGDIRCACILDMLDRMEADHRYVEGMRELDDYRGISSFELSQEDRTRFIDLMGLLTLRRSKVTRKAVVATSEEVKTATRAFMQAAEDNPYFELQLFSDLLPAIAYLKLNPSDFSDLLSSDADHVLLSSWSSRLYH